MTFIEPFGTRVVVRPISGERQTHGGIYLPSGAGTNPNAAQGTIVAVSDTLADSVAVGDEILYNKSFGTEVVMDDETFVILDDDGILAVKRDTE